MFTRSDAEAEIFEDRIVAAVGKGHPLKNHFAGAVAIATADLGRCRALAIGQLLDIDGLLEQFANPFHRRQAALDLGEAFGQLAQGIKQALGIEDEGGEGAQAHHLVRHHPAPQGQHHGNGREGHPFDQGRNGAIEKDRAIDGLAIGIGGAGKAGAVVSLAAEHLHHLKPLQVFLQIGIELAQLLAHPVVGLAVTALQPEDRQRDGHLADQEQGSEPGLDRNHRDRDHQQGHQIGQYPHGAATEDLGHGIHIAGEAGEQLADGGAVVEAQGEVEGVGK